MPKRSGLLARIPFQQSTACNGALGYLQKSLDDNMGGIHYWRRSLYNQRVCALQGPTGGCAAVCEGVEGERGCTRGSDMGIPRGHSFTG